MVVIFTYEHNQRVYFLSEDCSEKSEYSVTLPNFFTRNVKNLVSCHGSAIINIKLHLGEIAMDDELDRKIIQELQKDGRKGYVDLASELKVAEGTVRRRIKHLLQRDIIKIVAAPNVRRLGYDFVCIMALQVSITDLRRVATNLAQNEHVCYLAFVTGRYDLIAIVVAKSPEEYRHFLESELYAIPGVVRTEAFVNLDVIKGSASLPDTTQLISKFDISSLG